MADKSKTRTRLMIDISPELRRRIKIAAAQHDKSIKQYVVDILEANVPKEGASAEPRGRLVTDETIERFKYIREKIMKGRRFTDDTTDIINEAREGRTAEL